MIPASTGDLSAIEAQASRTTMWEDPSSVVDPPPQLRYETTITVNAGDVMQFLARWKYLSGRVDEYCRALIEAGDVSAPPPGGMVAADYCLQTREREQWLHPGAYEQELIAWSLRARKARADA